MTVKKIYFICFLCFGISSLALGQIPKDSILSSEVLTKDLLALRQAILKTHENPFAYCSVKKEEEAFMQAYDGIQNGATTYQFTRVLGNYLGVYKDSHTSVNYDALISYMEDQGEHILNLRIASLNKKIYIRNDKEEILENGLQIISINGHSADSLFDLILEFSVIEGNSYQAQNSIGEALFGNFINLVCDIQEDNQLVLFNPQTEKDIRVNYPGVTIKELRARNKKKRKRTNPFSLEFMNEDSLAWITVKSFSGSKTGPYYRFLNKSYRKIRKMNCPEVVVDLRNNTGGQINRAESLFQLFTEEGSVMPKNIIANQSEQSLLFYNRKHRGLNRWFINHFNKKNQRVQNHKRMINLAEGQRDTLYYEALQPLRKGPVKGEVYVLMNGLSGSASVLLLSNFKSQNAGILVGEECLGPMTGTWGNATNVHLKESGVNVLISILRTNTTNDFSTDPEPIQPDWKIEWTPEDIYFDKDPYEELFSKEQRNIRILRKVSSGL